MTNGGDLEGSFHRRLMARANHEEYQVLTDLPAAQAVEDGTVILDGSDASQIYVVSRAADVHCSEEVLGRLLLDLDQVAWCGKDPDKAKIFYERHPVGSMIYGGTGGGRVTETPWIHTQFERIGLADKIREVLAGASDHL